MDKNSSKEDKKKPAAKLQKSYQQKPLEYKREWYFIDASGKTLGRLASEIAKILRGKHKVTYTPNVDCGDGVVITNVEKIAVTGNKSVQKIYYRYTGYVGKQKEIPYERMLQRKPGEILRLAVKGMVPKTKLGNQQLKRLKLFVGNEHTMVAQKPIEVK